MVYRLGVKRDLEVDVEGDRKSLTVVLALGVALVLVRPKVLRFNWLLLSRLLIKRMAGTSIGSGVRTTGADVVLRFWFLRRVAKRKLELELEDSLGLDEKRQRSRVNALKSS